MGARSLGWIVAMAAMLVALSPMAASADDEESPPPPPPTTTTTTVTTTTTAPPASAPGDDVVQDDGDAEATVADDPVPAPKVKKQRRTFVPVKRYNVLKKLVFPVVGVSKYWSGFGDCRDNCTREHHGIDILTYGWKGVPVVAAHDGTVVKVTYEEGNAGCSVRIRGKDRWETRYLHLNNDFAGTDEPGAPCPAPGIEVGTQVVAGQVIGYIGDSGNAEHTVPHLHFELRSPNGYPIDPYRSLRASKKIVYEWLPADTQTATITLANATHAEGSNLLVVVPADEVTAVAASETSQTILDAPMIAIDPDDPLPAVAEIQRLAPERIVGLTGSHANWLREYLRPLAPMVAVDPIPAAPTINPLAVPAAADSAPSTWNPPDRFVTFVVGVVDRLWRSQVATYETFTRDHKAIVLATEKWAPRRIGSGSWTWPGKYAAKDALWWPTADGWVSTELDGVAPDPGVAFVTERLAQPWTLNHLGSLADLPPMPQWRSD